MTDRWQAIQGRVISAIRSVGVSRWIIIGFFLVMWIVAAIFTNLNMGTILGDCLVRSGMHGVLVLALVLPVRSGNGLNFGTALGIICGLAGGLFVMELVAPHPFKVESWGARDALARGWTGFILAHAVALPLAAIAGWGLGLLLERMGGMGMKMMVGIYVSFGSVAIFAVICLVAPLSSPEVVWAIGGKGARNTVLLDEYYKWILDARGEIRLGAWEPESLDADGNPPRFTRPPGLYIPTGLLVYWLALCGLLSLFLRTRLGAAMSACGSNPEYARSIGISVSRMRVISTAVSSMLAASGILVYSQSYGFFQLYKGPLFLPFYIVAALLLGGATLRRASMTHVVVGTLLFFSLLTTAQPLVNELVRTSPYADALSVLPEIARLVIQNGVILYALSRVVEEG